MSDHASERERQAVMGQKYAYATASLLLGIFCYVHLLGLEKALLAVVFGWMALRAAPEPALRQRRAWAWTGLVLGVVLMVLVPAMLVLFRERLAALIAALERLQ